MGNVFTRRALFCLLCFVFFNSFSFAQDMMPSRLLPNTRQSNYTTGLGIIVMPFMAFPGNNHTENTYGPHGYGFAIGMQKHVFGPWSGVLEARLGHAVFAEDSMGPLSFFSKIEWAPRRFFLGAFEPYLTGGLGYSLIFNDKSISQFDESEAPGEMAALAGVGVRVPLSSQLALKIGYDYQRGVQSSRAVENVFLFGFIFGDAQGLSK